MPSAAKPCQTLARWFQLLPPCCTVIGMKRSSAKDRIRKAVAVGFARDEAALERHVEETSTLSADEIIELSGTDTGMRQLLGSLQDIEIGRVRMPKFNEVVVAEPGPMTDEEYAKVLSGGSRHQWGPWRRLAKNLMARRRPA